MAVNNGVVPRTWLGRQGVGEVHCFFAWSSAIRALRPSSLNLLRSWDDFRLRVPIQVGASVQEANDTIEYIRVYLPQVDDSIKRFLCKDQPNYLCTVATRMQARAERGRKSITRTWNPLLHARSKNGHCGQTMALWTLNSRAWHLIRRSEYFSSRYSDAKLCGLILCLPADRAALLPVVRDLLSAAGCSPAESLFILVSRSGVDRGQWVISGVYGRYGMRFSLEGLSNEWEIVMYSLSGGRIFVRQKAPAKWHFHAATDAVC